jgi:hypothetical protein
MRFCRENCQLYEKRDLIHSSGLSPESAEEIKKNTHLPLIVQFNTLTTEKTFTRQLPVPFDNCFLTPAVTTDINKQYTTACPLLPAAKIRLVLLANSVINFV